MTQLSEEHEVLLSGFLDGELNPDQARLVEELLQADPLFRREFEQMKRFAVGTRAAFTVEAPPDYMWEDFLGGVLARLERRAGWLLLIAGALLLIACGLYYFVSGPWAPAWVKVLAALPAAGLLLLFVSVLRQRLRVARTDRYSREVYR
jgi:anti-sigma factor RsiW